MIIAETWERAREGRMLRDLPIFKGARSNFVITPTDRKPCPQAFLVEQFPGVVLQAHFHSEPQFQVVANGSGAVGAHPVKPFSIHYTSEHSPYGPISASAEGVWYFTLRAIANEGAFFMPEDRAQLRRDAPRVQITVEPPEISDAHTLMAREHAVTETLIEPRGDGLAAWFLRVPHSGSVAAPTHARGGGRYYVVAAGDMLMDGGPYPRLSAAWVSPEDEPLKVNAGPNGLEVMVLQFPAYAAQGAPA